MLIALASFHRFFFLTKNQISGKQAKKKFFFDKLAEVQLIMLITEAIRYPLCLYCISMPTFKTGIFPHENFMSETV